MTQSLNVRKITFRKVVTMDNFNSRRRTILSSGSNLEVFFFKAYQSHMDGLYQAAGQSFLLLTLGNFHTAFDYHDPLSFGTIY